MLVSLTAAAMVVSVAALAFPPARPYDPRPLLPAAEKKITGDKYTFIVMGDSKNGGAFPPLVKRAEAIDPALVLLTGDLVEKAMPKPYDLLEKQIGAFARKVPCWPCTGNHDIGGLPERQWPLYVKFWGIDSRHYSFDFKNARFISVHAPVAQPAAGELAWLETQLAEGKKAGKLLFVWQHMPCYTVGIKTRAEITGRATAFTRLLAKYGVVANFSGHDHSYYRTRRDAVTYIIQALGGAGIYSGDRVGEAVEGDVYVVSAGGGKMLVHNAAGEKNIPYMGLLTAIEVDGKKVTGRTMASDGQVIDEFTLSPPPAGK
jgi:3',5'-cyclic AMP phosphodiesterase CpdA